MNIYFRYVLILGKAFKDSRKNKNFPITQGENPELKQKTQSLGDYCLGLPPNCMIEKSLI